MRNFSEIKNGDAIDLLADILEPAAEIFSDKAIEEAFSSGKPKIVVAKAILKGHKSSLLEIFAAMDGVPVEEYSCNVITIVKDLITLLNDPEISSFFSSADQKKGAESSGSATENTEENEK